jgi:hypothetical protein
MLDVPEMVVRPTGILRKSEFLATVNRKQRVDYRDAWRMRTKSLLQLFAG